MRECAAPGCHVLVAKGRCAAHRLAYETQRRSPSARGYDHAWLSMRARVLREEWSCRICEADAKWNDHVDHVVPLARGGTNERENLQRLCHRCHSVKTLRERKV
jgi:5-methylcytosine-specific restriction enzyme A